MKHVLSSFALLLLFSISYAQNGVLTGIISDKETSEPLISATVILRSDPTIGSVANFDGVYRLELPPGQHVVICRFTGMMPDTFSFNLGAGQTVKHNFALKPYPNMLGEIEVKVGKFDKPIEDLTVSMEVIKPQIIENKNTRSIETILDQTPGLNILDGEPQIRGGSGFTFGVGSKVAVIVDDMPMLSGDAGRPEWGFIPVENIEQIEVIKGASSVLSGSSALSGAIHIRTAYPRDKPVTKVNVYTGMYSKPADRRQVWYDDYPGIHGMNFLHSQKFGNFDLVIGGNFNHDHGYIGPPRKDSSYVYWSQDEPPALDTVSNFSNRQMASTRGRINFNLRHSSKRIKGLNYGLNGNAMLSDGVMAFAWLNDTTGFYQGYPGAVFTHKQFITNLDPFVQFFQQTGAKHTLRGRFLHSDNQISGGQDNRATVLYGDYQFQRSYKFLHGLDFIGGVTAMHTNSYAQLYIGSGSPNNKLLNISGYGELEKKFFNVLNISIGGRLEYFQLNDSIRKLQPIFRAGASLKLFQETYLRASYGQGYRFPTITERFIRTGIGDVSMFANPTLRPEKSWNAEVGLKQGFKFWDFMGYFDVAGFLQQYQNTIEYLFGFWENPASVPPGGAVPAGFRFVNTGESRVVGIDLSFQGMAKLGKHGQLTVMVGYNYIVPTSLNPDLVYAVDSVGNQLSYNATSLDNSNRILKYRSLHNVKADLEFSWKGFSLGASFKYFSRLVNLDRAVQEFEDYTLSTGSMQPILYMNYFNNRNTGHPIFDARISYEISDMHKIGLISANLLNRMYSLRPLKAEPPRTIMLQYTFKLDQNKKKKEKGSKGEA